MKPSLAVFLFGFNLDAILYPWREAIASASDLADAVFFAACDYETYFEAYQLAEKNPKLHVSEDDWEGDYRVQAHIANRLLDAIGTQYDFALKLDADEVLHEDSFDKFREDLEIMARGGWLLGRPHYTHLCPDDRHEFDFIYRSKSVLSWTSANFRFSTGKGGDACALGGAPEYQTRLEIMHLGKMQTGREREALVKEYEFQKKYVELGFPDKIVVKQWEQDGFVNYDEIFAEAHRRGEFRDYNGPYPKYVMEWLENMRLRSREFWSTMQASRGSGTGEST